MKMLMPSHARNVKLHKDTRPLFSRHKVDGQLDGLFSPTVTLPSGGYLVMNQTEALVAIDINSGKATREHNIEDTALKTNMEAADEIARQLRLRDLAGLIVIDFIDMDEKRNNRNVERRLKEALKNDRARIQVGRISHFGLLEMSRQRLRQGMLEGSTRPCPHCEGTGLVRSVSSSALSVLRGIEENLMSRNPENLTVYCNPEVANYIVNDKREHLLSLETGYGVSIFVVPRERVLPWESEIERGAERPGLTRRPAQELVSAVIEDEDEAADDPGVTPPFEAPVETSVAAAGRGPETSEARSETGEEQPRRRRRRGRRGGRRSKDRADMTPAEQEAADQEAADEAAQDQQRDQQPDMGQPGAPQPFEPQAPEAARDATDAEAGSAEEPVAKPKRARRPRRPKPAASEAQAQEAVDQPADQPTEAAPGPEPDADAPKPKRKRAPRKAAARKPKVSAEAETQVADESAPETAPAEPGGNGAEREPEERQPEERQSEERQPEERQPEERQPEFAQPEPESEEPRRWQPPAPTPKPAGPPRTGWWRR
jgi:ribonuclease E